MSNYDIKDRSYRIAKYHGLTIVPSHKPKYKIDAYYKGEFIDSFGANGYSDYPTYIEEYGKKYADYRRELYLKRHPINYPKFSPDWLSKEILWS